MYLEEENFVIYTHLIPLCSAYVMHTLQHVLGVINNSNLSFITYL